MVISMRGVWTKDKVQVRGGNWAGGVPTLVLSLCLHPHEPDCHFHRHCSQKSLNNCHIIGLSIL